MTPDELLAKIHADNVKMLSRFDTSSIPPEMFLVLLDNAGARGLHMGTQLCQASIAAATAIQAAK